VHELVQTLRLPRWQLVIKAVVVVLVAALVLALGVWWGFVVPVALLVLWGLWWDFSRKPRGGWRAAPMGSFAVVNGADPTFLVNERGDSVVDQTGRTYAGSSSRVPTVEEQAAMGGSGWAGVAWILAEAVVIAALVALVVQLAR
jgi:hypothetical protein